jgi:serine/threonine protein kinase
MIVNRKIVITGDLIPRHVQILKTNSFYVGVNIPNPQRIIPLERRVTKFMSAGGMDFLKKCLEKDPAQRPSASQLKRHTFWNGFTYKLPVSHVSSCFVTLIPLFARR